MALTGKLNFSLALRDTGAQALGIAAYDAALSFEWILTSGVGLNQADRLYVGSRSLAASATEDLDVFGVLTSAFGVAMSLVKIKGLFIKAAVANPGALTLSRPAANGVAIFAAASDAIVLDAGSFFGWAAPSLAAIPVTTGTADLLTMTAAATAGTYLYDVAILGTSA